MVTTNVPEKHEYDLGFDEGYSHGFEDGHVEGFEELSDTCLKTLKDVDAFFEASDLKTIIKIYTKTKKAVKDTIKKLEK